MKDLYKSFVLKILVISFISAFFCSITNTGFSQWRQTNGPQGAFIGNIVFNGTNILYAKTENYIYRSFNNGYSWTLLKYPGFTPYYINAKNSLVVAADGNTSIYISTNNGNNWVEHSGIGVSDVNSITFYNDSIYVSRSDGIYSTTDKGITWNFLPITVGYNYAEDLIFVGDYLYTTSVLSNTSSFLKSSDFGRTWTKLDSTTILNNKKAQTFAYADGAFYMSFGYDGLYKSADDCKTWDKILSTPDIYEVYVKYGNGKLYAFTLDSLYESTNSGSTWTIVKTIGANLGLYALEFKGNTMFAGFHFPGVLRSTNGGQNWVAAYKGMIETSVSGLITIGNYLYASHVGVGINRTTGTNWQKYSGDLPGDIVTAINLDSNIFYAASSGDIFRSTNYGLNWNKIYDGSYVQSVKCIYAKQGNIYFGTSRHGIYISNDDGATWRNLWGSSLRVDKIFDLNGYIFCSRMATHIPNGSIYKSSDNGLTWTATAEPTTSKNGYIINKHNGNLFCIQNGKLYKSTDLGDSWNKLLVQYEDSLFNCMHSDKGVLYCGTSTKSGKNYLRYSIDNGTTFNKIGDSLPAEVTAISVKGNYLYAGVQDKGVWRINKSTITSENNETGITPLTFSLSQNYPNPFNPTTKIKYDIARLGNVKIVIYDVMGREVQTLVNESLKPGTYEASFDGSQLTSGVYFYKMITDGFTETRKMILIK